MKYLALIYAAANSGPKAGTPEFNDLLASYRAATERFRTDGVYLAGEGLKPTTMATTIKLRNGKTETMDGPFAETKEQLAGFYLLDCANLDDAITYAAMIPTAAYGSIEIRPIMTY